jgi:hypothetical protein
MLNLLYVIVGLSLVGAAALVGFKYANYDTHVRAAHSSDVLTQIQQLDAGLNAYLTSTWDADTQALIFADSDAALHAAVFPAFASTPAPTDSESWHVGLSGSDDVFVCVHNIPESIRALVWRRAQEQFGSRALAGAACEDDSMRDSGSPASVTVVTRTQAIRATRISQTWDPAMKEAFAAGRANATYEAAHPCYGDILLGDTCYITGADGVDYEVQFVGYFGHGRADEPTLVDGSDNPAWTAWRPLEGSRPRRLFVALEDEVAGSLAFRSEVTQPEYAVDGVRLGYTAYSDGWYMPVTADTAVPTYGPRSPDNKYWLASSGWLYSNVAHSTIPAEIIPGVAACMNKPGGFWYLPSITELKSVYTPFAASAFRYQRDFAYYAGGSVHLDVSLENSLEPLRPPGGLYLWLPAEIGQDAADSIIQHGFTSTASRGLFQSLLESHRRFKLAITKSRAQSNDDYEPYLSTDHVSSGFGGYTLPMLHRVRCFAWLY